MKSTIGLRTGEDGRLWFHQFRGSSFAPHRHAELEFNLVTQGQATYVVDGQRYDLAPHTLIWLHPAQDHVLVQQTANYAMWIAVIRPAALRRLCRSKCSRPLLGARPAGRFCRSIHPDDARALTSLFQHVRQAYDNRNLDTANAGVAYAFACTWDIHGRAQASLAGQAVHPAVARAARLLRESEAEWTVDQLAAAAGLSGGRLSRLFHAQMGLALARYRQQVRLDRFLRACVERPREDLLTLALEAGFGSYPQFHRVFRAAMGCSPAAYRQSRTARS